MKVKLLIILLLLCNTKSLFSQIEDDYTYLDTVNHIMYHYGEAFPYKNYYGSDDPFSPVLEEPVFFPEIINMEEKTYSFSDSLFLDAEQLRTIRLPKEIPDSLFNILYLEDIVNEWPLHDTTGIRNSNVSDVIIAEDAEFPYKDRDDYLAKERPNFKMYSLGNVKLNANYTSKLILILSHNEHQQIRRLFLINIKDNRLKCVSEISECRISDNNCYCNDDLNLEVLSNGRFSLIGGVSWSKYASEEYRKRYYPAEYSKEYYYYPKFFFDDYGWLNLLRGRYNMPEHIK
jgi:hypothetical protein